MQSVHKFSITQQTYTWRKVRAKGASYSGTHSERMSTRVFVEDVQVEMVIDLDTLAKLMAVRATRTKSGVSSYQDGLIKCKVLTRSERDSVVTEHPLSDRYELA